MSKTEQALTQEVIARLEGTQDARYKRVMASLVSHLHAFVRDVELTEQEWFSAIDFLTRTGQTCSDLRQEFILLSDTLGVSMLVDAINHRFPAGATETTVFGPFHRTGAPAMKIWSDIAIGTKGETLFMSGRVLDATTGTPVAGAMLDIWQADGEEGLYDVQRPGAPMLGRGVFCTDDQGRYGLRAIKPTNYPIPSDGPVGEMLRKMGRHPYRPAHVHAMVSAPGFRTLITHVFMDGDPYLGSDAVFGVKDSLIVQPQRRGAGIAPDGSHCSREFLTLDFDFRLAPAANAQH